MAFAIIVWVFLLSVKLAYVVSDFAAKLAMQAQSREQEYAADVYGARLGYAEQLAFALDKLERASGSVDPADGVNRLLQHPFSTHPPTEDRILPSQGDRSSGCHSRRPPSNGFGQG